MPGGCLEVLCIFSESRDTLLHVDLGREGGRERG